MQTFRQFISEGRDAPLYHATGLEAAKAILKTNKILPLTTHQGHSPPGCSVTRSLTTAAKWSTIIFELDQTKLVHNHKIQPINIQAKWSKRKGVHAKYEELFEEFIIDGISDLKKYLIRIIVDKSKLYKWIVTAKQNIGDEPDKRYAFVYEEEIEACNYWLNYPGIVDLKDVREHRQNDQKRTQRNLKYG